MTGEGLALLPENVSCCIIPCSTITKMTHTQASGDDEKDVSKRMGIEGASEILQESACVMGKIVEL